MIQTYIPLYRKYRPQAFADVVGQKAVIQTLGNAINLNKVAHAYLFTGPRGTGKTSTARIFAKSLNCEQGPTVTPCQTCASCSGITEGNAIDVVEFDAASNNGVSDARELIENCQYSSMSGKYKVYIIDEVHMLSTSAFNALLKTLEEPPPNVIFIFATTEAHKVLPTIVSRCQRFDFSRITTQDIVARLNDVAAQEEIAIEDDALFAIARHSRGGMRDALGLLDQVSVLSRAEAGKVITRQDVLLFIGSLEEEILLNLSQALAEKDSHALLEQIRTLFNRGVEPAQIVKEMTHHFRNLLLVKVSGVNQDTESAAELLDLPQDYYDRLMAQVALYNVEEIPQMLSRLSYIERNIRHTQQSHLWLEVGLLELAYRTEIHVVQELSDRVAELEARLSGQPMPPAPAAKPQSSQPPVSQPAQPKLSTPPVQKTPEVVSAVEPQQVVQPAQPVASQPVQPVSEASPVVPVSTPVSTSEPVSAPQVPVQEVASDPKPQVTQPQVEQPQPSQTAVQQSVPQQAVSGDLTHDYQAICQKIPSPGVKSILKDHTNMASKDGNVLTITVGSDPILAMLQKPDKMIHLKKTAEAFYGEAMQINLVLGDVEVTPQPQLQQKTTQQPTQQPVQVSPQPSEAPPVQSPQTQFQQAQPEQSSVEQAVVDQQNVDQENVVQGSVNQTPVEQQNDNDLQPQAEHVPSPVSVPVSSSAPQTGVVEPVDSEKLEEAKGYTQTLLQGTPLD